MKGSTRGALHLAESGIWYAWQQQQYSMTPIWEPGSLMETALAHWPLDRLNTFLLWYRKLPKQREIAA